MKSVTQESIREGVLVRKSVNGARRRNGKRRTGAAGAADLLSSALPSLQLGEVVKVAYRGISANKVRTGLTMLGIVIGVGAVIMLMAIGEGQKRQTLAIFERLGSNRIMIRAGRVMRGGVSQGIGSINTLKLADADAIQQQCPAISLVSPEVNTRAQVKYKNENTSTSVSGAGPALFAIENMKVAEGRAITTADVVGRRRVAVLGSVTKDDLFFDQPAIGKNIKINGKQFKVVGVLVSKGDMGFQNPDDQVIVPVTTAQRRLMGIDFISGISAQIGDPTKGAEAEKQIRAVLTRLHPGFAADSEMYRIFNASEMQREREMSAKVTQIFLLAIGAIALLIGGIGIMNIMLVTVSERTREVGLRKALGGTRQNILTQFVAEAVLITFIGGVIGLVIGILASIGIGHLPESLNFPKPIITLSTILVAFGISALIGIVFGVWPAKKAADLEPIQALRYE
jgi:putative ABC transport system permease protein